MGLLLPVYLVWRNVDFSSRFPCPCLKNATLPSDLSKYSAPYDSATINIGRGDVHKTPSVKGGILRGGIWRARDAPLILGRS